MPDVLLRRRSGLILGPADGLAELDIERFPMGRDLLCTLKRARSNPSNRHYWACLQAAVDAMGQNTSRHALHLWLLKELGHTDPIILRSGRVDFVPTSTAFDRMEPHQFEPYKQTALAFLEAAFGISTKALRNEGAELLGNVTEPPASPGRETREEAAEQSDAAGGPASSRTNSERVQ